MKLCYFYLPPKKYKYMLEIRHANYSTYFLFKMLNYVKVNFFIFFKKILMKW